MLRKTERQKDRYRNTMFKKTERKRDRDRNINTVFRITEAWK